MIGGTHLALGAPGSGGVARRPVRGRGGADVARQRRSPSHRPRTRSSCSATRSSWTSHSRAAHPPGAERSALAHLLGDRQTMPPELGLFLRRTWRLHPDICAFTSEAFYEGRLEPEAGLERQVLRGTPPLDGTGIRFVRRDPRRERQRLARGGAGGRARWCGRSSTPAPPGSTSRAGCGPSRLEDVLIVTPYNAQVRGHRGGAARGGRRHRGQVPGPGGAGLHLLDGHQLGRRRAARHGVPVQPEPPQRGHVTGPLRHGRGRQPGPPARPLPHARARCSSPTPLRASWRWPGRRLVGRRWHPS